MSGLADKLVAMFEADTLERLKRSWCVATKQERKHRLRAVVSLSVELETRRQESIEATGLAEAAIEAVIEGDWPDVKGWVDLFTFPEDQRQAARWETFRAILATAAAEHERLIPGVRNGAN